ncbi:5-methylcytosine-specific restriction system specificity protein McrC [Oceaniferula spumae]|uniref:5-methylcytosine-specific restriction system specificity protein McrC n=1 Tax=Oceaniferula spumae TaxID=2979115 RepID=A0AAT9FGG4_9BACT
MSKVPIQNLYYLLSYAWNHKLREEDERDLDASHCPDLNNFFARILNRGVERLLARGLDRSYIGFEEQTARIRGSIDFPTCLKRQTMLKGQLHCKFDELSADVPHNRIIKACLRILASDKTVDSVVRIELRQRLRHFHDVRDTQLHLRDFYRLQLHRNNRHYRFILHLCHLIYTNLLPEQQQDGRRKFKDFLQDEKHMAWVFEHFVLNFAKANLTGAKCRAAGLTWQADEFSPDCHDLLPTMLTDVTIAWPDRKLILDCKYYADAIAAGQHGKQRFRTGHLYQLNAYLSNAAPDPGWEKVEGMLLYPTNGYALSHHFRLHGRHRVHLRTIDLNQSWLDIESQLMEILQNRMLS